MSNRVVYDNADFVPILEAEPRPVFFMSGFDAVSSGNDEYILLTPSDREVGEVRQFYQLPNDAGTVQEMMSMAPHGSESIPYLCPSLVELLFVD